MGYDRNTEVDESFGQVDYNRIVWTLTHTENHRDRFTHIIGVYDTEELADQALADCVAEGLASSHPDVRGNHGDYSINELVLNQTDTYGLHI